MTMPSVMAAWVEPETDVIAAMVYSLNWRSGEAISAASGLNFKRERGRLFVAASALEG